MPVTFTGSPPELTRDDRISKFGRLAGCLAAGAEPRDGRRVAEPQATRSDERARVSVTVPLHPAITRARRNSAARRAFVPDGTTAV